MKESMVFYKSFYEAIKSIPEEEQLKLYNAIFEYSFTGKEQKIEEGIVKGMFNLMKPNIDSASARYKASVENGKLGGRPKKETQQKPSKNLDKTQSEPKQNLNDNVDVYVDDNDNDYISSSLNEYMEKAFGRTISSTEYLKLEDFLKMYDPGVIKHAIDLCVLGNKKTMSYLNGIIRNWRTAGYKDLKEIKENEEEFENKKKEPINELFDYNWLEGE